MAFKQPRVPEYRASAGTGKYLKDLTIFLKDFCLNSWKATAMLERSLKQPESDEEETVNADTVAGMTLDQLEEYFERRRLDKEHPVGGAPYISFKPQEQDDPNVKWPWTKWELTAQGRALIGGGSSAYPVGKTGGAETVMLDRQNIPLNIALTTLNSSGTETGYAVELKSGKFIHNVGGKINGNYTTQKAVSIMQPYLAVSIWKRTS
jgi:hypothetical protein